jgi:diguanylate cyclase (GGDEF)-like protein/PAS domain S-box-containing protein
MFDLQKEKLLLSINQQTSFYIIAVAISYFLLGRLSIYANSIGTIVAPTLFIPAGLSLLMAFLLTQRFWISIFVGEYLIAWTLNMPWGVSIALGLANALSFLLALKLITRWRINPDNLSSKTFWLQNWLIIITQIVSAVIANLAIHINNPSQTIDFALTQTLAWFLSNVLTQLLLLPIGLSILLKKSLISKGDMITIITLLSFTYFFVSWELGNPIVISIITLTLVIFIASKSKNLANLLMLGLTFISWNLFVRHQGVFGYEGLSANSLTTILILIALILHFVSNLSETLEKKNHIQKALTSKLLESKNAYMEIGFLELAAVLKNADEFIQLRNGDNLLPSQNFNLQLKYAIIIAAKAGMSSAFNRIFVLYFLVRMLRFNKTKTYVPFNKEIHSDQIKTVGFIADCLAFETNELLEIRNRYLNDVPKSKVFNYEEYPEFIIIGVVEEFYDQTERHGVSITKAIKSIRAGGIGHKSHIVNYLELCLGDILIARGFFDDSRQLIKDNNTFNHNDNIEEENDLVSLSSNYFPESERVYKTLFDSSSLGLALVDFESGHFLDVNKALVTMTGFRKEELLDKTFWDITPRNYADQEERQLAALRQNGKFGPNEKEYIRKDGTTFPISIEGFISTYENKKCVWGIIQDLTKSKTIAELSEEKIGKDFLTGLANRYLWEQRITQAIALASRNKSTVSLILIDMDRFKAINDNYGHQIGDEILIEFSNRIHHVLRRKSDTPARLGGDEFAVLLPDTNIKDATSIAKNILESINSPFLVGKLQLNIHCSIGISTTDNSGYDEKILFETADTNLLKAKKNGRNQYIT